MDFLNDFSRFTVVRLNANLFPITESEAELYRKYHFEILEVEVNEPDEIIPHVAECDGLFAVSVALPTPVIESLSRCRVISRLGAGTDKIDVRKATENGILVTNIPDFCVEEQADHTMALVRKLPKMSRCMSEGAWTEARMLSNTNRRLSGRVLGLLGFGQSSVAVARRAKAFGMKVLATRRDMSASPQVAKELDVEMVDLNTLLGQSDYVSLHLPLNDETTNRWKPGASGLGSVKGHQTAP